MVLLKLLDSCCMIIGYVTGGLVMELRPARVCLAPGPGTRVTFTCSYRSSQRLDIQFDTSYDYTPRTRVLDGVRDVTARHNWGATRMWTRELGPDVRMVTCRLTNRAGVTVGQLHARVYSGDLYSSDFNHYTNIPSLYYQL